MYINKDNFEVEVVITKDLSLREWGQAVPARVGQGGDLAVGGAPQGQRTPGHGARERLRDPRSRR